MNQIKTHIANGRNYTIVQVPKDAYDFEVSENYLCFTHDDYDQQLQDVLLPPGQYTLLFIAEEATEEQALQVVRCVQLCDNAITTMQSLIRSLFPNWADYKHVILQKI